MPASPPTLEASPSASASLDVLVDLGHLDDDMLAVVNDRLLDVEAPDGVVSLDAVRRVTAEVIFERETRVDPELRQLLDGEWTFLFH